MRGPRGCIALLIACCFLLGFEACFAQDTNFTSDYSDNEIDLVPTYRSGIEKVLQGLMKVGSTGRSSASGVTRLLATHLPKPIKSIIIPDTENTTVRGFGDVLNLFQDKFHAIFPGTLWCGGGNIANSETEVGVFKRTDNCCRAHDNCPSNIDAGRTKENLVNNGIFTRSACSCDQQFYDCLKDVSSVISANIGTTYFNILRPQCFSYDYPIESCAVYGRHRLVNKKCLKYNLDDSQNKTLVWLDSPDF